MRLFIQSVTLVFCSCFSALAQDLPFKRFGVDDGLPSSNVHEVYQDKKGFMWFATDQGLAKYNGTIFQVWDQSDDAPSSTFLHFYEEEPNRVWISSIENQVYCFNPFSSTPVFHPFELNDSLEQAFIRIKNYLHIRNFWFDEAKNYHFTFGKGVGQIIMSQNGFTELTGETENGKTKGNTPHSRFQNILVMIPEKNDERAHVFSTTINASGQAGKLLIYSSEEKDTIDPGVHFDFSTRTELGVTDDLRHSEGIDFLLGNYLFRYSEGQIIFQELAYEGMKILHYKDQVIVATRSGLEFFSKDLKKCLFRTHPGVFFTNLTMDHENGLWASSLSQGVFYFSNTELRNYHFADFSSNTISSIHPGHDFVCVQNRNNRVIVFKKDGSVSESFEKIAYSPPIFSSLANTDLSSYFEHVLSSDPEQTFYTNCYVPVNCKEIQRDYPPYHGKEVKIVSTYYDQGLTIYTEDEQFYEELDTPPLRKHVLMDDTTILACSTRGLWKIQNYTSLSRYLEHNEDLNTILLDIQKFRDGYLILSETNGIIFLKDKVTKNINLHHSLELNNVLSMEVINDHEVWVGTSNGVSRIRVAKTLFDIEQNTLTKSNGLPTTEALDLAHFNDTIWVATKNGVSFIPRHAKFTKNTFNKKYFQVDSIRIDGVKQYGDRPITRIEEGQNLEFFFTQISFRNEAPITFEYFIEGYSLQWEQLTEGKVSIPFLYYGTYTLKIRALSKNYEKQSPIEFQIHVSPPFSKSWLGRLVYLTIGVILIYFLFRLLLIRNNRKKEAELHQLKLELRALIAQMNPHFTFNTINSIQHYIIKKERDEALNYLSEFALLIRKALEFSRRELITLSEELDFLRLYTSLEQKRFDRPFEFKMELLLNSSKENILFPPLLLQPIIENSIIHGVSTSSRLGEIKLSVEEFQNHFILLVQDNGKGFDPAVNQKKDKDSVGLDILRQRIRLYNGARYTTKDMRIESNELGTTTYIKLIKR